MPSSTIFHNLNRKYSRGQSAAFRATLLFHSCAYRGHVRIKLLTWHPADERCPIYFVLSLLCAVMWNHCAAYYQGPFSPPNTRQGIPGLVPSQVLGFVTHHPIPTHHSYHLPITGSLYGFSKWPGWWHVFCEMGQWCTFLFFKHLCRGSNLLKIHSRNILLLLNFFKGSWEESVKKACTANAERLRETNFDVSPVASFIYSLLLELRGEQAPAPIVSQEWQLD